MKKALPAICWFRDDLRIDDNPALLDAYQIAHGRVVPVYIIDPRRFQQNLLKWPDPPLCVRDVRERFCCGDGP